jgi:hypothetical protein
MSIMPARRFENNGGVAETAGCSFGPAGARRDGLLEQAHALDELVKVRSSNARPGERTP